MANSNPFSSTCRLFLLLTFTLLLVNVFAVNAQDNTNSTNSNTSNANVTANRNSNSNQSGNANSNASANSNQKVAGAATTTDPKADERRDKLLESNWFFALVTLMFAVVLVPFAWTIVRSIRFSHSTYNSPLGLPEGSVRAILAYTLVAFLGFYILAAILSLSEFKPPDFLAGIVATVIGFYFGSRSGDDRPAAAAASQTGSVQGDVTDKNGAPAAGASVELSQSGAKKLSKTADAGGKYKFDNVPLGDYDIQASLPPNGPSNSAKVKVTAGAAQTANLKLT